MSESNSGGNPSDLLDAIPMPPEPSNASADGSTTATSGDASVQNSAWAKAQQALSKIQPPVPKPFHPSAQSSSYSQMSQQQGQQSEIQSAMLRMYPWMSQYGGYGSAGGGPFQRGMSTPVPPWMANTAYPAAYGQPYGNPVSGSYGAIYPSHSDNPSLYGARRMGAPTANEDWRGNYQNNDQPKNSTADSIATVNSGATTASGGSIDRGSGWNGPMKLTSSQGLYRAQSPLKPPGLLRPPGLVSSPRLAGSQQTISDSQTPSFSGNQDVDMRSGNFAPRGGGSFAFRIRNRTPGQPFGALGPKRTGANCEPLGSGAAVPPPPSLTQQSPLRAAAEARQNNQTMPDGVAKYIERAYLACENDNDKNKVEAMLKQKLTPMLHTGTAWKIDWDNEPLPTDPNFQLLPKGMWTPAKDLRGRAGVSHGQSASAVRPLRQRTSKWGNHEPHSTQSDRRHTVGRTRRRSGDSVEVLSDEDDTDRHNTSWSSVNSKRNHQRTTSLKKQQKSPYKAADTRKRGAGTHDGSSGSENSDHSTVSPSFVTTKTKKKQKAGKKQKKQQQVQTTTFTLEGDKRQQEQMKLKRAKRFADKQYSKKRPTANVYRPKVVASRLRRPLVDSRDDDDPFYFTMTGSPMSGNDDFDLSSINIVGTCQDVEKAFFRLTTAPDPSDVRPAHVLRDALSMVKRKWRDERNYRYVCDQLKSMRQDLTIQCIKSELAIEIYETHARISLENGDREEFNQCQNRLKVFYREFPDWENRQEFTAYRLLYYVYLRNTMDMNTLLAELDVNERRRSVSGDEQSCLTFARRVSGAWSLCSYARLFQLYRRAPRMSAYVMDWFIDRERRHAVRTMLKSYRPFLPIAFVCAQLAFATETECREWLLQLKVKFSDGNIDCRHAVVIADN